MRDALNETLSISSVDWKILCGLRDETVINGQTHTSVENGNFSYAELQMAMLRVHEISGDMFVRFRSLSKGEGNFYNLFVNYYFLYDNTAFLTTDELVIVPASLLEQKGMVGVSWMLYGRVWKTKTAFMVSKSMGEISSFQEILESTDYKQFRDLEKELLCLKGVEGGVKKVEEIYEALRQSYSLPIKEIYDNVNNVKYTFNKAPIVDIKVHDHFAPCSFREGRGCEVPSYVVQVTFDMYNQMPSSSKEEWMGLTSGAVYTIMNDYEKNSFARAIQTIAHGENYTKKHILPVLQFISMCTFLGILEDRLIICQK